MKFRITFRVKLLLLTIVPLAAAQFVTYFAVMMSDEHNKAIVGTTIELAHNMKLAVVAEGIEDESTLRQISGLGCEQAQGYFISKPVSSDDLLQWLNNYKAISYTDRRNKKRKFAKKA